jgi:uncharacterized protein YbjQ (UPF0145 family)
LVLGDLGIDSVPISTYLLFHICKEDLEKIQGRGEGIMIIVTTDFVPGKEVKELKGFVRGSTVQAKHIGKDIIAGLKTIIGGEISEYSELMEEARKQAIDRMMEEASQKGANAIIAVRLETSAVMQNASEIIAYGTAVVVA